MRRKIGLLGPYGTGNLGDAAVQEAVMHNLRIELPDAEFVGISLNPADTRERHGIEALPARRSHVRVAPPPPNAATTAAGPERISFAERLKSAIKRVPLVFPLLRFIQELWLLRIWPVFAEIGFLARAWRQLREFDVLLVSGGGQLNEYWGGPWAHPYTLFKWALVARLAGARMLIINVGAGQFDRRLSRFFIRSALRLAEYRSFRDIESQERVAELGDIGPSSVHPDQVFGLPVDDFLSVPAQRKVICVNPLPYYDPRAWPEKDAARYQKYLSNLAELCIALIKRDFEVRLLPTQVNMDRLAIDDLARVVEAHPDLPADARFHVLQFATLTDLLEALQDCDVLIASRLHGMLIAHLLQRPALAVSPDPKLDSHLRAIGQLENCLPADDFDVAAACERCIALHDAAPEIARDLAAIVGGYRDNLSAQYASLFESRSRGGS